MSIKRCADIPVCPRPRKKMTIRIVIKPSTRFACRHPFLPDDVILDILLRLPPRSVTRFKSVCKAGHAMISDPGFVDAHLECSKGRPSLLMVPSSADGVYHDPCFMGFYKYRVGHEAELMHLKKFRGTVDFWTSAPLHCNGLILVNTPKQRMMICNPATGEFVALPRGSKDMLRVSRAALGFDPRSKKYKVTRFFYQKAPTVDAVCKFEVLTLGTDTNVWRRTADDPLYPIVGRTPVHVQGNIYWTTGMTSSCPEPPYAFLRFNLADEQFSLVSYPPSNFEPARLVEWESELCCVCFCRRTMELEIWSLSVGLGQNAEWTRRCNMVIASDLLLFDSNGWATRPPKVVLHGRMLILTGERKVYRYDMVTRRMEKIASDVHDIRYHDQNFIEHSFFTSHQLC